MYSLKEKIINSIYESYTMKKAFDFLKIQEKPKKGGVIEIRGSYYSPVVLPYLQGLLELAGDYIDGFKFAGCSQRLHPVPVLKKIINLCHKHKVYVSTGGMIERIYVEGKGTVNKYLRETKKFGFDVVEVSSGLIPIPLKDKVDIVKQVHELNMKSKPEIAFNLGAGAGSKTTQYETKLKLRPLKEVFKEIDAYLKQKPYMLMFESEGITEDIPEKVWRKDIIKKVIDRYGLNTWMFEAADPKVFKWYLKNYGPECNFFIDHSQIIELQCWRSGLWGDPKLWKK